MREVGQQPSGKLEQLDAEVKALVNPMARDRIYIEARLEVVQTKGRVTIVGKQRTY